MHKLKAALVKCKQSGHSLMMYYGLLKKMWDELVFYKPLALVVVVNWRYNLKKIRYKDISYQFLMGLDDARFGHIRSTIVNMEPLSRLSQVINSDQRIVCDERQ